MLLVLTAGILYLSYVANSVWKNQYSRDLRIELDFSLSIRDQMVPIDGPATRGALGDSAREKGV